MAIADDLAELGLSPGDEGDKKKIRKAYLKLSCSRHPDKGGSTESFQRLSNAYTRLAHPEDEEEVEEEEEDLRFLCFFFFFFFSDLASRSSMC